MIKVTGLVKRYGSHVAVDHLSFQVETGQIYGFLGPNGAGKSTTMNILTGYLCANEGTVEINGHDIFNEPEKANRLSARASAALFGDDGGGIFVVCRGTKENPKGWTKGGVGTGHAPDRHS